MGASVSHAAEMDGPTHVPMPEDEPEATSKTTQLPQPVKYEDLQREVLSTCCERKGCETNRQRDGKKRGRMRYRRRTRSMERTRANPNLSTQLTQTKSCSFHNPPFLLRTPILQLRTTPLLKQCMLPEQQCR
mmetsp:Transcript_1210/g.7961  ORF Transcript_1210/g.7961 Transcript_1210/m.7961 type:complete len:132 (+) Transcript_1210:123-518(+)